MLLLDSRCVASVENACLKVGTVVKHPANPLFSKTNNAEILTWSGFPERKLLFRREKYYHRT